MNDTIVNALSTKSTLAYLEFLDYNLGKFNTFNTLFQADSPNFYCLKTETCRLIRGLCSDFMDPAYVKHAEISLLDPAMPTFSSAFLPIEETYLGVAATCTINELKNEISASEISQFYKNCRAFLIEAVSPNSK